MSTPTQAWTGCCRVTSQLTCPQANVTKTLQVLSSDSHVNITPKQNTEETQSGAIPLHKLSKQTAQEEQHEGKMPPCPPTPVTQTSSVTVSKGHKATHDSMKLTKP